MIKKIALSVLLIMISTSCFALGREYDNNFLVGAYGGGGFTWPGGNFNRVYETEPGVYGAAAGGIYAAWAPAWFGALTLGIEYAYKPLQVNMNYLGNEIAELKEMHFIDILFGWRGFISFMYYEFGFFAGIPIGTWENSAAMDGDEIIPPLGHDGEIPEGSRQVEYGMYIGLGALFWITELVGVEGGVQFQGSFRDGYVNEDNPNDNSLRTRTVLFKVGAVVCF